MTPDDLPILGEPLAIELANTRYGEGLEPFDFLGTRKLATLWLHTATASTEVLSAHDYERLVRLRDAVFFVVRASCTHRVPAPHAVAEVNHCASLARTGLELTYHSYPPAMTQAPRGRPIDQLLRQLATETITLVAQPDGQPIHQCAAPDCTLFFVKDHHRRRWCHPSCGHRTRQAAYMQRKRDASD